MTASALATSPEPTPTAAAIDFLEALSETFEAAECCREWAALPIALGDG